MTTTIYVYDRKRGKVVPKDELYLSLSERKSPAIHGDFPAELVGTKCPQSGITLTNKREYERELDRRGLCSLSPGEFKRQMEAQGMGN